MARSCGRIVWIIVRLYRKASVTVARERKMEEKGRVNHKGCSYEEGEQGRRKGRGVGKKGNERK